MTDKHIPPKEIGVVWFKDGTQQVMSDSTRTPPNETYVHLDEYEALVARAEKAEARVRELGNALNILLNTIPISYDSYGEPLDDVLHEAMEQAKQALKKGQ